MPLGYTRVGYIESVPHTSVSPFWHMPFVVVTLMRKVVQR